MTPRSPTVRISARSLRIMLDFCDHEAAHRVTIPPYMAEAIAEAGRALHGK